MSVIVLKVFPVNSGTINELTLQRDLLLAALNAIRDIPDNLYGGDWDEIDEARKIAREAIAKCES